MKHDILLQKLDIETFISSFYTFFSRDGLLFLDIDNNKAYEYLTSLSYLEFKAPKQSHDISHFLALLKKEAKLKIVDIYEFIKIISYFRYLNNLNLPNALKTWLSKIETPQNALNLIDLFDKKGELEQSKFQDLEEVNKKLYNKRKELKTKLQQILHSRSLEDILVDKQIHYRNEKESLLVRSGFSNYIKAKVLDRSSAGFFYVIPVSVEYINSEIDELISIKEQTIYKIEKEISSILKELIPFFTFANKEFIKFDSLQARVFFAKSLNLEFIKAKNSSTFNINSFYHPAINHAKPISIEFDKSAMFITGVNAGGKSMLLKSILTCSFCSKYLIPIKIDSANSTIPTFKSIHLVLDDPQNVKNDISTFAGRMVEFKELLLQKNTLIGVDEIELGTDANEAAALFKVLIEQLIKNNNKIVITTHHKRLASIFASGRANLIAAIYDEEKRLPTYEFLSGTIGKSYAFETALRYGIGENLVLEAKEIYGEDQENLDELIQGNIELEFTLKQREKKLKIELEKVKNIKNHLYEQKNEYKKRVRKQISQLTRDFESATDEAKKALKLGSQQEIHKQLNIANKRYKEIQKQEEKEQSFDVGDMVKFKDKVGEIQRVKGSSATVEFDSMTMSINLIDLTKSYAKKTSDKKGYVTFERPSSGATSKLDIHGLRAEEALEKIEKFINLAILNNLNEVLIYHGVGSGILASITHEYLGSHPHIKEFKYAAQSVGGMGATLILF